MCRAVRVVRSGEMGYFRASKYFSVPIGTLEKCVKGTARSPEELVNVHLGRRTVLRNELENKLVEYCIIVGQRLVWTETSGHRTHGFSVDNNKWFETTI